jgi:hypothetical protein
MSRFQLRRFTKKTELLRYISLLTLCLLLMLAGRASAADWAKNFGGFTGGNAYTQATATDASGNTYLAGYFSRATLTLGSVTLTRIGSQDAFVAKLDASGTVLWAKNFGGSGATTYGQSIAVDGSGNIYLGGDFGGANLTTPALTTIGSQDAFALKLDSTGAITWAKSFGGSGATAWGRGIAVDGSGNVYLGGLFAGNLTTPALTTIGSQDAFALKLDSTGATTWAMNFGGSGASVFGKGIAVDGFGNVYVGGYFVGANLTTPALTKFGGQQDAFALKLDSTGATTWAKNFGGDGAIAACNAIAVDGSGNVYLGGYFGGADLTTPALTKIGGNNAFALKLDSTGATTWAKNFGGSGGAYTFGQAIAVDGSGNVYLGGDFCIANLTTPALTKIGSFDGFALKLDSTGATTWAKSFGGSGSSAHGQGIAVDGSGNVHLGGYFTYANLTTPTLTKIGNQDALALKLDSTGATIWARNFGGRGGGNIYTQATAVDASGNRYLAGFFDSETVTIGSVTLTRIGSMDAYVAKLDSSSTVLWARNFGGSGATAYGNSIAVDSSGNVYLGGDFGGANLTTPALTKIGTDDSFALKLDSTGATTWARNFGGSGAWAYGGSITVDGSGNVYLGGYIYGANLTTPALTKIGDYDAFVLKLDSIGATTWVKNFGGSGAQTIGSDIAVDGSGSVYLGGHFQNANLTTPSLTKIGSLDAFALKLDSTGATTWVRNFGGSGASTGGTGIAVDGSGNVYLGGYFSNANLTSPALTKIGARDAYALKLDSTGATTWAKNFGGSGANAFFNGIAVDGSGNVYLGGDFGGNLTTPALTKIGDQDAFAIKLNSTGTTTWAKNFGGSGATASGLGIAVDGSGYAYLGGYFSSANLTTPSLTKIGSTDAFIIASQANRPPTAMIQGAPTISLEMVIGTTLTAPNASPSTDADGDALSYSWDLNNDGTFGDASGVNPSLTWAQQQAYGLAFLGDHTVRVQVTDTFGATSTASATLRYVDTAPPSSSPSLPGGMYNNQQSITLSCSDSGSGCATTYYCLGTGCSPTTQYTGTTPIFSTTDLRYYSVDNAGNSEAIQATSYTIAADYPVNLTVNGTGSGTVTSNPSGIACNTNCSANFAAGSSVSLHAEAAEFSLFNTWSGACTGKTDCTLTMDGIKDLTATFDADTPHYARCDSPTTSHYSTITEGYQTIPTDATLMLWGVDFIGDVIFNMDKVVTIKGGYNGSYSATPGLSTIVGSMSVSSGTVTVENIAVK